MTTAHEIDFKLYGDDMQFIEVELDGGESVIAEAGAMMYMDEAIGMETIFGDGSGKSHGSGLMGKLMGAGKRIITGEGLFLATLRGPGSVWLQSLPFSRMADRIYSAAGGSKGESKGFNNPLEELSGLTNLFGRD